MDKTHLYPYNKNRSSTDRAIVVQLLNSMVTFVGSALYEYIPGVRTGIFLSSLLSLLLFAHFMHEPYDEQVVAGTIYLVWTYLRIASSSVLSYARPRATPLHQRAARVYHDTHAHTCTYMHINARIACKRNAGSREHTHVYVYTCTRSDASKQPSSA